MDSINDKDNTEVEIGIDLTETTTQHDGVVAALPNGEVNYKSMSWWHVGMLMIAETISLGILSLPYSVAQLGLIPGIIFILVLGLLATYSGYVIGQFKLRHPAVHSMADAGYILFGSFGYHLFCWAALLSLIFIMAAHILTFAVAMNVLTGHGACTILWAFIGFLISVVLTLPRTLKNVAYLSIVSFISIITAILIVMISIGIAPPTATGLPPTDFHLIAPSYTLTPTFVAILNICIAFMGNVAFFGFISELREPRDFPKSLALLQSVSITFYIVVGALIYHFVGSERIVSPALGAASPTIQKIAYGVAMPTIIVAGVINAHVAIKQVYVQLWSTVKKQPDVISQKSFKAIGSWVGIVVVQWFVALILALAIPVFHQMLGLISALFGSWFTYGVSGMFWMSMNQEKIFGRVIKAPKTEKTREDSDATMETAEKSTEEQSTEGQSTEEQSTEEQSVEDQSSAAPTFWKRMGSKKIALLVLNVCMISVGAVLCGVGLYASAKEIADSDAGKPFSCANNAPKSVAT